MNNKKIKLKEIAEVNMGQSPNGKSYNYIKKGMPFLQGNKTFGNLFPTIDTWTTEPKKIGRKSSILMSVRAPVGDLNVANQDICIGRGLCSVEMFNENNMFIYYALKNSINEIKRKSTGTVFDSINRKDIEEIELINFSKEQQNKIITILSTMDKKIELNNQINNNLEDELDSLFYKYIWNNIENKRTNNFQHKILYDVFNVIDNRGKTPQLTDYSKFPIIDVKALSGEGRIINYNNCTKYVSEDVYNSFFRNGHPRKNDILISTVGSLAEMKLFIENKGTIAQNVVALRPKIDYPLYLYQYLKRIKNDLASYNIGSVQPSIKVTQFMKHDIWLVPKEECTEFEEIARTYTDKLNLISKENIILKQLRDTLLPKLMNGEIDLDKIEI